MPPSPTLTAEAFAALPDEHRQSVQRTAAYLALADAVGDPIQQAIARGAHMLSVFGARIHLIQRGVL